MWFGHTSHPLAHCYYHRRGWQSRGIWLSWPLSKSSIIYYLLQRQPFQRQYQPSGLTPAASTKQYYRLNTSPTVSTRRHRLSQRQPCLQCKYSYLQNIRPLATTFHLGFLFMLWSSTNKTCPNMVCHNVTTNHWPSSSLEVILMPYRNRRHIP